MSHKVIENLILLCGFGHIGLCAGSIVIPRVLKRKEHLKVLQPLLRQMFWTYAGYILIINLSFGVVSVWGFDELLNGSFLAKSISLFICLYWIGRVGIQFFYFDKTDAPKGLVYTLGEITLVGLFIVFAIVYGIVFLSNMKWI